MNTNIYAVKISLTKYLMCYMAINIAYIFMSVPWVKPINIYGATGTMGDILPPLSINLFRKYDERYYPS